MQPSQYVTISINLLQIRENVISIRKQTGVRIIAVVKADAYGIGAQQVAAAMGDLVDAFYVFDLHEAMQYRLHDITKKSTIALLSDSNDPQDFLAHHIRPVVFDLQRARLLENAYPLLSVDSGQGRFGCDANAALQILEHTNISDVFTHATTDRHIQIFEQFLQSVPEQRRQRLQIHAAGTSLLNQPHARFHAVRPGLALYQNVVTVSTKLIEVRESNRPAGYSGFVTPCYGLIRCGYSNGIRPGICQINGSSRKILEVGMQSAFVEVGPHDQVGDDVLLLGGDITPNQVATLWQCSPQEVLLRLCSSGQRVYV